MSNPNSNHNRPRTFVPHPMDLHLPFVRTYTHVNWFGLDVPLPIETAETPVSWAELGATVIYMAPAILSGAEWPKFSEYVRDGRDIPEDKFQLFKYSVSPGLFTLVKGDAPSKIGARKAFQTSVARARVIDALTSLLSTLSEHARTVCFPRLYEVAIFLLTFSCDPLIEGEVATREVRKHFEACPESKLPAVFGAAMQDLRKGRVWYWSIVEVERVGVAFRAVTEMWVKANEGRDGR